MLIVVVIWRSVYDSTFVFEIFHNNKKNLRFLKLGITDVFELMNSLLQGFSVHGRMFSSIPGPSH